MTDDLLNKIVQLGTLAYPLQKIINVLDIEDVEGFTEAFYDPLSDVARAYQKGVDKSDFVIDSKLFDMAKNGDLKALEKYEANKKQRLWQLQKEKDSR